MDQNPGRTGEAVPPALGALLGRAIELHRGATNQDGYEPIWSVLDAAKEFGRDAVEAAMTLLTSEDSSARAVACDLLGTLCEVNAPELGAEVASALIELAESDGDADVLWSIARALGSAQDHRGLVVLARLARHSDGDIRYQVALALPFCEDGADPEQLAQALIDLTEDPDDQVRNVATFGLGTQTDLDAPNVRAALGRRLADEHQDVRDEAIVGLARRRNGGLLPIVAARIQHDEVGKLAVEAAAYLSDPILLAPLQDLETWWDLDPDLLNEALACCDPQDRARQLAAQTSFMAELEAALAAWQKVSVSLSCPRFGRGAVLRIDDAGHVSAYDLKTLVIARGGGDTHAAVRAVLDDLQRARSESSPHQADG